MDLCLYYILEFVLGILFLYFRAEERRDCMIMYWLDIACLIGLIGRASYLRWLPECRAAVGVNFKFTMLILVTALGLVPRLLGGARLSGRWAYYSTPHIRSSGRSVPGIDIPRHGNGHHRARGLSWCVFYTCVRLIAHANSCSLLVIIKVPWAVFMGSCMRGFPRKACI